MKRIGTRAVSYRTLLALLLMFTANIFLSQVGVMAQKKQAQKAAAPQSPATLPTDDPQDNAFTVTGSTGTLTVASIPMAKVDFNFVGFQALKTGAVRIHYNIVAVEGANLGTLNCEPICDGGRVGGDQQFNGVEQVRIRYRDSDGHGNNQRVLVSIWQTNIMTGVDTKLFEFDSNVEGQDIGTTQLFETTDCEHPDFDFNFEENFYWIEVDLTKTQLAGDARLSLVQIQELQETCSSD